MNIQITRACALACVLFAAPAVAQSHDGHDQHQGHGHHPPEPTPAPANPDAHGGHGGHDAHAGHAETERSNISRLTFAGPVILDMGDSSVAGMAIPAFTDGSGTARLPGAEGRSHSGLHLNAGDSWMVMAHGYAWGVHTNQSGPRGDEKSYMQTMAMLSAERDMGWGRIQLRTMLSLEPLMDNRGYPNLFGTGETANGIPLVDRQHPHDLFMELAGRVDANVGHSATAFLYGGLVGEPAIGPAAFMHRRSARYNPEAPITHHWFDATHITYGVFTAGYGTARWQLESSMFRGAEPDEQRWNIETPRFDSWSIRATWTPSPQWAIQLSHARLEEPEAQHPGEDEARTTASVHYASANLSAMLAWSRKNRLPGDALPAWLAEVNWDITDHHTLFARAEVVSNDELFPDPSDPLHDQRFRVAKMMAGYAWRTAVTDSVNLALGGTVSTFAAPTTLDAAYGRNPWGWTLFARLSVGL